MDAETRKELDALTIAYTRLEARNMAMQWALADHLKLNEEHRDALNATLQSNYLRMLTVLVRDARKKNPVLAARLFPENEDLK